MSVVAGAAAQPNGVGVQQLYDGTEYWGEWQGGKMHGWGVWRTIDGETEYRGQLFDGKYCGYGVLRECGTVKTGRWVDGTIVVQQRFSASAMFAARDAAIRAGVAARHIASVFIHLIWLITISFKYRLCRCLLLPRPGPSHCRVHHLHRSSRYGKTMRRSRQIQKSAQSAALQSCS